MRNMTAVRRVTFSRLLLLIAFALFTCRPYIPQVLADVSSHTVVGQVTSEGMASPELVTLRYTQSEDGNLLKITPVLPYLERYSQGGPVPGLLSNSSPFVWDFPAVSIKIVNNSTKTIALNEAVVESKDSISTPGALLIWDDLSFSQLVIHNEGWTGVTDAQLQIDIASEDACVDWPTATRYVRKIQLADFDTMVRVPIREYIPSRFLNDEMVCVFGYIVYQDPALGGVTRTINYKTRVLLHVRSTAAMPPSNFYHVKLHADRSKEIVRVPLEQKLAPKEADHFVLSVGADKSGRFSVEISLSAVGGKEIAKRQFDLDIFVPRSQAKRVQELNRN